MPATIKATLKAEPNAAKEHAVRIRVTAYGQPRYYDTGIRIAKKHWNPKATYEKLNWIKDSYPPYAKTNFAIRDLLNDFTDITLKQPNATAEEIIHTYTHPVDNKGRGFFAYSKEYIRRKNDLHKFAAESLYDGAVKRLQKFAGENPDESKLLTIKQMMKFQKWMQQKKYAVKTINSTIQALNKIYKDGVFEGWVPLAGQPFQLSTLVDVDPEKPRPETPEILKLADVIPKGREQLHARNLALMLYFLGGARVSEGLKLEWEKNIKPDYVAFLPSKRAKKTKKVKRHAGIEWILSQYPQTGKYVFPYINEEHDKLSDEDFWKHLRSCTAAINHHLKPLSEAAKMSVKLSTRMLRRAYADAAGTISGDIRLASKGIGHGTVAMTEIYTLDKDQARIDAMNQKVYQDFEKLPEAGKTLGKKLTGKRITDTSEKK